MSGIVVGVDGSPHSQKALDWAISEAALRNAHLDVVAVAPAAASIWGITGQFSPSQETVDKVNQAAKKVVDEAISSHGYQDVSLRTVASGRSLLDPGAAARVMRRMREQAQRSDPLSGLTDQERRILELIGEGLTNRQIGERLFLAEKTVKNYVSALFAKLGMERRAQAAAYAARVFDEHGDAGPQHYHHS